MATVTERLAIQIEANASKAIAEFRQVGGAAQGLQGNIGKAGGALSNLTGQLGGLFGGAGGGGALGAGIAAASTGAAALATFIASGVSGFLDLAKQVDDFRRITGLTAEDASRLVAVFDDVGVEASAASAAIFQLEKRLGSSTALLGGFGIQVARTVTGQTDMVETILRIGDAYKGLADPVQKAQLLTTAFGKTGASIAPLLERPREVIESMFDSAERTNQIFSSADLLMARQYREAIDDLQDSFRGLQIEAGQNLIPFLVDAASLATKLLGRVNDVVAGPPKDQGGFWNFVADTMHAGLRATGDLISLLPGVGDAAEEASAGLGPTVQDVEDLGDAVAKMVDADRALASAHRGLEADQRALADAQKDYNELLTKGAVDAEKVADTQRSLAEATRSVGHAQREQRDAQREFNKAAAAADILGTDTALEKKQDAADNLADANDSLTSAIERQNTAQKELDKARAGDPDYQDKLAAAKQKVADQTQRIADAEYQVGQKSLASIGAHKAEEEALIGKAEAAERLLADYTLLIAQHPEVAAVLGPQIPVLTEAAKPGGAGGASLGGLFGSGAALPFTPAVPIVVPSGTAGSPTTNNTFNITAPATIDPLNLANAILWNLN
jgi:hypothetical protein